MTRRRFLKTAAGACAAAVAFPAVLKGEWKKVKKVVIVRFGGGVRFSESFGDPTLATLPYMTKHILQAGTLYTNMYNDGATNHVGGTLQILTGAECTLKDMSKRAPKLPTIFEYYRQQKGRKAAQESCAIFTHSTLDVSYHQSVHSDFGPRYGGLTFSPRLLMYERLFNVMESEQDQTTDIYRRARDLRERLWVEEDFEHIENPDRVAPEYNGKAVSGFIKNTLERGKVPELRTPAVGDEMVLLFGRNAMKDLEPDILMLNFAGPDIAHQGSFSAYTKRIRWLDQLVVQVYNDVRKNRAYANNTLFIVTPDCGRSLAGKGKGGFSSHSSGDDGCRHVWALISGPGVKKGGRVDAVCSQYDLAPTIGQALGFSTPHSAGRVLKS